MNYSDPSFALALALLFLSPLTLAGIALLNTGLGRSRSAAQALLGNLAIFAVAVLAFALVGATLTGSLPGANGSAGLSVQVAGKSWNLIGSAPFLLTGLAGSGAQNQLALLFEFIAVAMAAIIPWGSGADRLRLSAGLAIAVLIGTVFFPVVAHWTLAGGWLSALNANFNLGSNFLDPAGAASIHMVGGFSALIVCWICGARRGKFPQEGLATAMPGHNAVYVLFGAFLALLGWVAWNVAGSLIWMHAPLSSIAVTAINTILMATAAVAATYSITRVRFGKPDASLCANGWMTGLVASSACAAVLNSAEAIMVGAVAGLITPLLVELLELALAIDDPSGAISVHAVGGFWGLLMAGIFSGRPGQFTAQLVGIGAVLGVMLPLLYLILSLADRWIPFRADPDGERIGMDLHELGGGAYPEFVIHRDDSYR